ncbi:MAG: VWA domain-containing protein, partial [Bacteroidetes bacterium]|nr:VWA domain-containing protein [Bacteroidota bacterium]
ISRIWIFLLAGILFCSSGLKAQNRAYNPPLTRILFVFDASFSMYGTWQSGMKMDIAKRLFTSFLDSLKGVGNLEIGLRCFGHQHNLQPTRDCQDTKLEVPIARPSIAVPAMRAFISQITPKGTTPIAYTLEKCADDFPVDGKNARNIIILITDGFEECDGDPCAVSLALQQKGIVLKPFVIGIGTVDYSSLNCIGKVYNVAEESTFNNILNIVVSQAMNSTTAQVNLLDIAGKPNETDVAMTFYDQTTGVVRYNYMHTMNDRGIPDTIILDPLSTYRLVVHSIPEVIKENIVITPGKHNIIAVDAPQGFMNLQVAGINNYARLQCIVRKAGTMQTVNIQDFGRPEKYIVGKYDIEILTLPRIYMNNVDIGQSKTTLIQIPQAGVVSIFKPAEGSGQILLEEKNKLTWVTNLNSSQLNENIVLQPGNYRIIYRSKSAHETIYTIERKFKIEPGGQVTVKLY